MGGCLSAAGKPNTRKTREPEQIPAACQEAKSLVNALQSREIPVSIATSVHQFTLAELRDATKDFDPEMQIGEGAFGQVFVGELVLPPSPPARSASDAASLDRAQSGQAAPAPHSVGSNEAGPGNLEEQAGAGAKEVGRERADDSQPGTRAGHDVQASTYGSGRGAFERGGEGSSSGGSFKAPAVQNEVPIGARRMAQGLEAQSTKQDRGGKDSSGGEAQALDSERGTTETGEGRPAAPMLQSAEASGVGKGPLEGPGGEQSEQVAGLGKEPSESEEEYSQVAIKRILDPDSEGFEHFLKEAVVLGKLRHPNLVTLHGICTDGGAFLVYELMPGGSLDLALEDSREGKLFISWKNRLKIMLAVVDALGYLHSKLFIHRDIKPSNILLDLDYNAKVTDFGMVRVGPNQEIRSIVNTRIMGSDIYIDPTYLNSGNLSFASDVFSFGVVLLELITGVSSLRDVELNNKMMVRLESQEKISWPCADFVDKKLYRTYCEAQIKQIAVLAVQCVSYVRQERPSMAEVQKTLHRVAQETCSNPLCRFHRPDAKPKSP